MIVSRLVAGYYFSSSVSHYTSDHALKLCKLINLLYTRLLIIYYVDTYQLLDCLTISPSGYSHMSGAKGVSLSFNKRCAPRPGGEFDLRSSQG